MMGWRRRLRQHAMEPRHRIKKATAILVLAAAAAYVFICVCTISERNRDLRAPSSIRDRRSLATETAGASAIPADPWSEEEHALFLRGLADYGPTGRHAWSQIANKLFGGKRSTDQVQEHWRDYYHWYQNHRDDLDRLPNEPAAEVIPADSGDDKWDEEEHNLFLQGLERFGPPSRHAWSQIANKIFGGKRSTDQVQEHWRECYAHRDDPDYLLYKPAGAADPANPEANAPADPEDVPADPAEVPWTAEEHALFLEGLGEHGAGPEAYGKIADTIATRSLRQVTEHANEYFAKLARGDDAPSEIFGWPSDEDVDIPPGTYFHNGRDEWKEVLRSYHVAQPEPGYGRVLLYISTHFSYQHILYLRYCWKNVLARSPLLQEADVAVHLNPNDGKRRKAAMDLLKDVFAEHNLMVYVRSYLGVPLGGGSAGGHFKRKQSGAVMAMYEAVNHKYFEGYDWVVRVNPDVLVRDDLYFRRAMANPELAALLVDCHKNRGTNVPQLDTDFFVVRPRVLREAAFPRHIYGTAEESFTESLKKSVLDRRPRNYEWIPGADPTKKAGCRVGAGRDFFDSPVVHEHALHPDICSVPEADEAVVEKVFPGGWPQNWRRLY